MYLSRELTFIPSTARATLRLRGSSRATLEAENVFGVPDPPDFTFPLRLANRRLLVNSVHPTNGRFQSEFRLANSWPKSLDKNFECAVELVARAGYDFRAQALCLLKG